jgi:hypothetical protein
LIKVLCISISFLFSLGLSRSEKRSLPQLLDEYGAVRLESKIGVTSALRDVLQHVM